MSVCVSEPSTTIEQSTTTDSKSVVPSFVTIIEPPRGWQLINAQELWNYRELLFFLAWRDIKVRYKQTVLGAAWAILQPAMMMLVFYFIFKENAKVERVVTLICCSVYQDFTLEFLFDCDDECGQ